MPDMKIPPEFELLLRQAMDAPEPESATLNALREQFITQGTAHLKPQTRMRGPSRPRLQLFSVSLGWKFALLVLAVLLLLALFSPQVVNALRNLFGYIPNVGVVDQSAEVLVLAEPVQVTRGEVTLTVEQAYATREKTVVVYRHEEPPIDFSQYQQVETISPDRPGLRLPDGSRLEVASGRRQPTENEGIRYALEFGPLPAKVTQVTLELTRLAGLPPGAGPEDWSIPLRFQPGDPSQILYPVTVYEPTPTPAPSATSTMAEQPDASPSPLAAGPTPETVPDYGTSLTLEKSAELPDGYLLMGSFQWTDAAIGPYQMVINLAAIKDANGQSLDFEFTPPDTSPQPGELRQYWAYKISTKDFAAPLRMEFFVTRSETADARFQFDPGPNPQDGQTWDLNLDLPVNTHQVKVVSVTYQHPQPNNQVFLFTMTADAHVFGAMIVDPARPPMGGGGGGNGVPQDNVPFTGGVFIDGDLPSGPLTFSIRSLDLLVPGDWTITWSPPEK